MATKYKGKGLSLLVDAVEVNMDVTSVVLTNEEADDDVVTFADLASGASVQWYFEGSAVADYAPGSLWSYLWDNTGEEGVAFVFKPYGNSVASASQPHFTGTLNVGNKPPVGGEAGSVFTFDFRLDVNGTPTRVGA